MKPSSLLLLACLSAAVLAACNKRDDADGLKGKLDGAGVDAQIVRVQR